MSRGRDDRPISVLSVHWGFSFGGVAQYAVVLEQVRTCAPIELSTVCIANERRNVDKATLATLANLTFIERKGPFDFRWLVSLRKILKEDTPDLVMTHGFNGHFSIYLARLTTREKIRVIASYHGEYHPPNACKWFVSWLYNWFTMHYLRSVAFGIVSVAECGRKFLVSRGVSDDKITVIHNGIVDVERADRRRPVGRRELGLPDDDKAVIVGAVSRLEPIKGVSYLIRAFRSVLRESPNAYLAIIGSGTQESYLKKLAFDLEIAESVIFLGFRSNVAAYLSALDVFVLPSLSEFHSIGLLEAMRASVAVVATDVGGNTESVSHGKEGLIVRPADVEDLAAALQTLVSNKELREQLGMAGRRRFLDEFTQNRMVKETADYLIRAIGFCPCC